jgi:hypothetical protein
MCTRGRSQRTSSRSSMALLPAAHRWGNRSRAYNSPGVHAISRPPVAGRRQLGSRVLAWRGSHEDRAIHGDHYEPPRRTDRAEIAGVASRARATTNRRKLERHSGRARGREARRTRPTERGISPAAGESVRWPKAATRRRPGTSASGRACTSRPSPLMHRHTSGTRRTAISDGGGQKAASGGSRARARRWLARERWRARRRRLAHRCAQR